jgi:transcriptional regulator with XRE-family HTH domain
MQKTNYKLFLKKENLKTAMSIKGIKNLEELCNHINISKASIYRIYKNEIITSAGFLANISGFFKVSPDMFAEIKEMRPPQKQSTEIKQKEKK